MKVKNKSAFTLVELLVVVLIIGILTAIAVPMYQSAVDKTHWSTLLPTARALKNAEEAYLMATNVYTDNEDALDVAATQGDATYELQMPDSESRYVIRATSDKLPNVRLAQYLDENAAMAGQLHCEAKTGDERANKLCEKLLMGQELGTTDDGYVQYLLDQEVDKATCDSVSRSWSSSKTKCYKTTAERCTDLGMPEIAGEDKCGYKRNSGVTIKNEGFCVSDTSAVSCRNLTIEKGGTCYATASNSDYASCAYSYNIAGTVICDAQNTTNHCGHSNTYNGGVCVANSANGCWGGRGDVIYVNGSICYANVQGASCGAANNYDDTSCCCGNYCGNKPKCADRGIACDPQYLK